MGFYYYKDGEKIGPVSEAELKDLAFCGKIKPDTLLVKEFPHGGDPFFASDIVRDCYFCNFFIPRRKLAVLLLLFLTVGFLFSLYLGVLISHSGRYLLAATPIVLYFVIGGILLSYASRLKIF